MYFKPILLAISIALTPQASLAAGGGGDTTGVPEPTETTKKCKKSKVWSEKKKRCVKPGNASLSEDTLYEAVREYAYAGQYDNAQTILRVMQDQSDDRVLTYWGFTHRKLGNADLAMTFYERAISLNPDNLLSRSYMGQAHVEAGDTYLAWVQLQEIRTRGGMGSWPEQSLAKAIQSGKTYNY
ncbi:Tetratricopeptide repeat-containing protein [Shimia gijangensis]|uniref:Tetratricopeptide repeat-containing protein n=1 Tax=Shimia gijangensis TaxID=1470563 RepID=A0A1M6EAW3_9RHOB|nr:tetratricopeptide repeat protein [Shimia gijangensis]SHI82553.1 Tetratricopeptide repeat-containing protein [Shimia gijangensis]